tara:strand:+ start:378 stop:668 length:291 start_codon:yes stop_codon:yes gene_type:complete
MNKMTPNKKRMHGYAKAGGLNAFKDGGSVLDNSDGVITSLAAAAAKAAAKAAKRIAKKITSVTDGFVQKNMTKTPNLSKQRRRVIANENYKPKDGR